MATFTVYKKLTLAYEVECGTHKEALEAGMAADESQMSVVECDYEVSRDGSMQWHDHDSIMHGLDEDEEE